MRDESWCSGCGCSQPYSEDEVTCGNCTSEAYEIRSKKLYEYMRLHLISLEQDSEKLGLELGSQVNLNGDDYESLEIEDISTNGQIIATAHLLSVARDILGIQTEEK